MRALFLLVLLAPACSVYAQTRVWIETGLNRHTTRTPDYTKYDGGPFYEAQKFNFTSPSVGLRVEQYVNYNFALVTGIHAWNYVIDSKKKTYVIQDHVLTQSDYSSRSSYHVQPKATWRTTYLTVPIGLSLSPQGKIFGIAAGVDVNFVVKSAMKDMADTLNTRYTYDATRAVNRINTAPFISLTFKYRSFAFTAKYFSFSKSLISENLLTGAMNNAQDKNAHIAPFYYSLYRSNDIRVHGLWFSVAYRIY